MMFPYLAIYVVGMQIIVFKKKKLGTEAIGDFYLHSSATMIPCSKPSKQPECSPSSANGSEKPSFKKK
jgi:hypothetical protein